MQGPSDSFIHPCHGMSRMHARTHLLAHPLCAAGCRALVVGASGNGCGLFLGGERSGHDTATATHSKVTQRRVAVRACVWYADPPSRPPSTLALAQLPFLPSLAAKLRRRLSFRANEGPAPSCRSCCCCCCRSRWSLPRLLVCSVCVRIDGEKSKL